LDINIDSLDFQFIRLIDESGQYVELDLKTELSVNEDNLEREMLEQPSKYVYWSAILERIRFFKESAELEMELLLGELDKEAREELPKHEVKATKDSVDAYIKRTENYKIAREKCNYYEYLVKRVQFIVRALEQRKDMLQSYGKQVTHDKSYGKGAGSHMEKYPDQTLPEVPQQQTYED
jgi:hypothetical protein